MDNTHTPVLSKENWDGLVDTFLIKEHTTRAKLRDRLATIGNYRKLDAGDQVRLLALLSCYREESHLKLDSMVQYARELCRTVMELDNPDHPALAALFWNFNRYRVAGVFNEQDEQDEKESASKHNNRVAALKALMKMAVQMGIIDKSHIDHLKIEHTEPHPEPATDRDVLEALRKIFGRIKDAVGCYRVLALRDLAMLEWKSYGIRSCEMAWGTRRDFEADPSRPRIRKSKTETGKRILVFAQESIAATKAYLKALDAYRLAKGLDAIGANDPLWIGIHSEGLSSAAISGRVSDLLPDGVRPHDLRARAATWLAKDHPIYEVAYALGIKPETTASYVAVADPQGVKADLAKASALSTFKAETEADFEAVAGPTAEQTVTTPDRQAAQADSEPADATRPVDQKGRRPEQPASSVIDPDALARAIIESVGKQRLLKCLAAILLET